MGDVEVLGLGELVGWVGSFVVFCWIAVRMYGERHGRG